MNHSRILKQAWKNVISYRALWIFGILLALTTTSALNSLGSQSAWRTDAESHGILGTGITVQMKPSDSFTEALADALDQVGRELRTGIDKADRDLTRLYSEVLGWNQQSNLMLILTVLLWTVVIFWIVGTVMRYLSETALVGMVDSQERSGEKRTRREGFRMGWSRASWRLFLIDLVIALPTAIVFLVLFAVIFAPLLLWVLGSTEVGLLGVALTSGLFFLFIFLAIVAAQAIRLLKQFARRVCVLEGAGVFDSVRRGFRMLKGNLKDIGLMWLVLLGVNIAWPIVVAVSAMLLIALALVVAGVLGILIGMTANLLGAAHPVVTGLIVGLPLFLLLLIVPLVFLEGLKEVFISSTWTLAYRDLRALSGLKVESLPEPGTA